MKVKKILAVLLALAMVLCTFNVVAFAESTAVTPQQVEQAIVENAYVAKIGEQSYLTLQEAIAAVKDGETINIISQGTYKLSSECIKNKNVTMSATVNGVIIDMSSPVALSDATVTFNNIDFDYTKNQNYVGLYHTAAEIYNNCTINGQMFAYGAKAEFNDCEFNQTSNDAYNIWTYGARDIDFNNCTFNSAGKSVLIYNEGAIDQDADFSGCTFKASEAVKDKAAIEVDCTFAKYNITVDSTTTATGFANGSVSGNSLWNVKLGSKETKVTVADEVVFYNAYVVKIGEQSYITLQAAIDAAKTGNTIKIIKDISLETCAILTAGKVITIDLNGKKIDFADSWERSTCDDSLIIVSRGADLTIDDTSDGKTGVIDGSANSKKVYAAVKLTKKGESATGDAAKLTVNGGTLKGYYYAVVGNATRDNTEITINGGTLLGDTAIYHPQDGKLTVNGGTLKGTTAVYFCAGDLVVNGGEFIADGEKIDYVASNGSYECTGDALVIDYRQSSKNGYGAITVSITGGKFVSKNAAAVASYLHSDASAEGKTALTGFITGGTFSSDVTALCKDGYKATENEDGSYGVSKTEKYESGIYYVKGYVPAGKSEYPYALLFTAGIDSLDYKTAGFRVTIDGVTNDLYINGYVWSKLTVDLKDQGRVELTPDQYNSNAKYIMYYILTFDESVLSAIGEKDVTVSAFVVTHDGEYLFTDSSNIGKVNS